MDELPSQIEKMKEAMTVIAEVRDSHRLRQFLELGRDRMYFLSFFFANVY